MTALHLMIIGLVLLAVVAAMLKQVALRSKSFPYVRKQSLLTAAERSFLGALDQAVGDEYRVFAQVRLADIVDTERGLSNSGRQKAFNRIRAKHLDFVLCDKDDLSVVCAIELDDKSHLNRERRDRDAFLEGLCQAISLPLLRMPAKRAYSIPELAGKIRSTIAVRLELASGQGAEASMRIEPRLFPSSESKYQSEADTITEPAIPTCPKCSAPMVMRRATTGSRAGTKFWGCSTFPRCRATL